MITKIDHIGIAVNNLDEAVKLYTEKLGLAVSNIEIVTEQKVRTAIIPVGESKIELLESTDPTGVIAKFIAQRGEGIHHIALGVSDVKETLQDLTDKGVPLVDKEPRRGVENTKIVFLHPKGTKILIEMVEADGGR